MGERFPTMRDGIDRPDRATIKRLKSGQRRPYGVGSGRGTHGRAAASVFVRGPHDGIYINTFDQDA
jgi:hypothetical protein